MDCVTQLKSLNSIKIHHLTDIHIGKLHYHPSREVAVAPPLNNHYSLDKYEKWLVGLDTEALPDFLIISGDLTSYALEEEIESARNKLLIIAEILKRKPRQWDNGDNGHILLVPGNHDLDWTREYHAEKVRRFSDMASSLYHDGIRSPCCSNGRKTEWLDFGEQANLCIALLDTTVIGGTNDPQLKTLHQNLQHLTQHVTTAATSIDLKAIEREMRKDPGYIDDEALIRLANNAQQAPESRIKIAVMHHNLTSVDSEDIDKFDTIINSGKIKSILIRNNFDVVLHGHRHVFDYTEERKMPTMYRKALKIVSGDSFGCKEHAPFIELEIRNPRHVHAVTTPFATLSIKNASYVGGTFEFKENPLRSLSPHIESHVHEIMRAIISEKEPAVGTMKSLDLIIPQFEDLRHTIMGWNDDKSDEWIRDFHNNLSQYSKIFASDIDKRGSLDSPAYHRYLREQYFERLFRLRAQTHAKTLAFSDAVYSAIQGADWQTNNEFWKDYKIVNDNKLASEQLEIVRILVRPAKLTPRQRELLERFDFDHRLFAIPLFVVTEGDFIKYSDLPNATDFAIGYIGENIISCYEFNQEKMLVSSPTASRRKRLAERFNRLLKANVVATIQHFGYPRPIMIRNNDELVEFADNYDATRKASPVFLKLIEELANPDASKHALDIGCGTGNYTLPFSGKFYKLTGVDALKPMLDVAKQKDTFAKINWINQDIILHDFEDNQFDAIWGISSIHYFTKNQQFTLLEKCFRWLKPGGVILFDTEFYEQHLSLWVTEYFPSLISRFKNRCLSKETYYKWLINMHYVDIDLKTLVFEQGDSDLSIRAGQQNPPLFLDSSFREGLPAFQTMPSIELELGLQRLANDICTGTIEKIINVYNQKAKMPGDFGMIIARKPS